MLFFIYHMLTQWVIPTVKTLLGVLAYPVFYGVILVAGMVFVFGLFGMPISNHLAGTAIGGIFRAAGWCVKTVLKGIVALVRAICRIVRRTFRFISGGLKRIGMTPIFAGVFGVLAAAIVLAAII